MFRGIFSVRRICCLLAITFPVSGILLAAPSPAHALNISDYFSYSYNIELSQDEVYRDDTFSAVVSGEAVCEKNLPINPSAASVTIRIYAQHETTGNEVVLNSGFTVEMDSFPAKQGDTAQETMDVPLSFPSSSASGDYTITGKIITAKVRVLTIWIDVTQYLPESQGLGSITCHTRQVSDTGEFLMKLTGKSSDGKAAVTIQPGTIGLTSRGKPLSEITVTENGNPPLPPSDTGIVGLVYDFSPEGAGFDRPVSIRFTYAPDDLPDGVSEKNLVMAVWDSQSEDWYRLDSEVDTQNNTVTAEASHFTPYAILTGTRPASFSVSNLSVAPAEAAVNEKITISVLVRNTGDLSDAYKLELNIDGAVAAVKSSVLDGGDSTTVSFSVYRDSPGSHAVSVGSLSGTFTIDDSGGLTMSTEPVEYATSTVPVTPLDIAGGESIAARVMITNTSNEQYTCQASLLQDADVVESSEIYLNGGSSRTVIFTAPNDRTSSYTVEIMGPAGVFTVEDMPPSEAQDMALDEQSSQPTATLNWWLIGGSIAAGIIIGPLVTLLVIRRRAQHRQA